MIRMAAILAFASALAAETLPLPKRLNNLVVEVVNLSSAKARGTQTIRFKMPVDGWVFLSARASVSGDDRVFLSFDHDEDTQRGLLLTAGNIAGERQLYLNEGEHVLSADRAGKAELEEIILRRIPETGFSKFGATPARLSSGDHDWPFLAERILPHINTIIGQDQSRHAGAIRQWRARGGRWITEVSRAAFTGQNPNVDAVAIDEFWPGVSDLAGWIERIPTFTDDIRFYWAEGEADDDTFFKTVFDSDQTMIWEKYLGEIPASFNEKQRLQRDLGDWMQSMRSRFPNAIDHSSVCLGMFSAPPLSLNRSTETDFKAWLDLQFQFIAREKPFDGLRSLIVWGSRYTDEETFRWVGLLFRHYCIEGQTRLLSERYGFNYRLDHIRNGDFLEGLAHWTGGGVHERVDKLALWQGRFPYAVEWDGGLVMENVRIKQTITNLRPGKLYSAKLIAARKSDLVSGRSAPERLPISLRILGAETLREQSSVDVVPSPLSGERPPFSGEQPLWLNYHCKVFRASATTAELEIEATGAPVLINGIEIQRYLAR